MAAVWEPDSDAIDRAGADREVMVRTAIPDQGFYANPAQFEAVVIGSDAADIPSVLAFGRRVWAWSVTETVPREGTERCAVAMVSLMRRHPDITPAGFARHWTERHAPLALRRHIGLHDYHQYVVTDTLSPDTPEIDGIALLGFRTRADFDERFFDSDSGRDEIMADVARFMDRPGRETTLVGPPEAAAR